MLPPIEKALRIAAILFGGLLLAGFIFLALTGFISDSEIWAINIAKHIKGEWLHSWVYTRPIFYGVLAIFTYPFDRAIPIFTAAKAAGALNGVLIVYLTFRLAKRISASSIVPLAAVIFLLANTGFMNQGYRIRSDLFACGLVLLALERRFAYGEKPPARAIFYWLLPLLATPKAGIYILPALTVSMRPKEAAKIFGAFLSCFLLIFIVYPAGWQFFLATYTEPEASVQFFSHLRFEYLERILVTNKLFVSVVFLRLAAIFLRLRGNTLSSEQRLYHMSFVKFVVASFFCMIAFPEKVPFFLASFIPIFCVFASLLLDDVLGILSAVAPPARLRLYRHLVAAAFFFVLLALTSNAAVHWQSFRYNNNSTLQFNLIRTLEAYLDRYPKAVYYDVIGLVPQRATILFFAGPNDSVLNKFTADQLNILTPDIIFYIKKSSYLEPTLSNLLKEKYFPIGPYAFALWTKLDQPLKLPLRNHKKAHALKEDMEKASGSRSPDFSVLLRAPGKPDRTVEVTEKDLLNAAKVGKKSKLVAISPFTQMGEATRILPRIIRFDTDWTGAPLNDVGR